VERMADLLAQAPEPERNLPPRTRDG
jgi:hypothetical protein